MKKIITFLFLVFLCVKANSQSSFIIGYEYWSDTAYSSHISVSTSPQPQFTLDTLLGFPGLNKGLHLLNIRFQQNNFYWSQTVSEYFYKTGEGISATGKITSYRYWVEGLDSVITFHLTNPVNPYDLIVTLDLSWVPRGSNYLYMQFSDEQDNWSVASVDSFYKSAIPVALFSSPDTLTCGSDSVHFQNQSMDADIYHWNFGDGDSSNDENPVHYYQQNGQYTVTLTVTDSASGTDSTITYIDYISIHPQAQASFTYTQVGPNVTFINNSINAISYAWDFGDSTISYLTSPVHTYPHDGNYTAILTAFDSCGSVTDTQYVSILLKIDPLNYPGNLRILQHADDVTLQFNYAVEKCAYSLQTITGQILLENHVSNIVSGHSETFSTANLAAGIYFLVISDKNGSLTRRLFVN